MQECKLCNMQVDMQIFGWKLHPPVAFPVCPKHCEGGRMTSIYIYDDNVTFLETMPEGFYTQTATIPTKQTAAKLRLCRCLRLIGFKIGEGL